MQSCDRSEEKAKNSSLKELEDGEMKIDSLLSSFENSSFDPKKAEEKSDSLIEKYDLNLDRKGALASSSFLIDKLEIKLDKSGKFEANFEYEILNPNEDGIEFVMLVISDNTVTYSTKLTSKIGTVDFKIKPQNEIHIVFQVIPTDIARTANNQERIYSIWRTYSLIRNNQSVDAKRILTPKIDDELLKLVLLATEKIL